MATATDDNAKRRDLDAKLFEKSTCWYTENRGDAAWLKENLMTKIKMEKSLDILIKDMLKSTYIVCYSNY